MNVFGKTVPDLKQLKNRAILQKKGLIDGIELLLVHPNLGVKKCLKNTEKVLPLIKQNFSFVSIEIGWVSGKNQSLDFFSENKKTRKKSIELLEKGISIADKLDSVNLGMHFFYNVRFLKAEKMPEKIFDKEQAIGEAKDFFSGYDKKLLCLENTYPVDNLLPDKVGFYETGKIIEDFKKSGLSMIFDTAHYGITLYSYYTALKNRDVFNDLGKIDCVSGKHYFYFGQQEKRIGKKIVLEINKNLKTNKKNALKQVFTENVVKGIQKTKKRIVHFSNFNGCAFSKKHGLRPDGHLNGFLDLNRIALECKKQGIIVVPELNETNFVEIPMHVKAFKMLKQV